ncbi:MAG: presenilin family intramembrane aspartyl protease PSH, partial [Candidatus Thermoplasmatota archaeon]|nr:presenilin family intramembrane aspartyl protease PSH [Candidatus Thermoplasmatota archaeon]
GENLTTAVLIPGKNHGLRICLSVNTLSYLFSLPGLDNCSTVKFPSPLGSTYILGDGGQNELVLYNRDKFEVFSLSDNAVVSIAKKVMDEKIDDLVVAKGIKGDDTEAVYVLSNGRIHLFGPDDWKEGYGYTEEKQKGASRLSVSDADGDGHIELNLLSGNVVRQYEISPVERHIWVWAVGTVAALALVGAIRFHPEWYVVDGVGILVAVGAIALIGISLAILPSLVLLVILAVYDAISVYKTKHMIDLADGVMEMRLPVLLVIPKDGNYSFRKQKKLTEELDSGEPRGAMFMGLGDIIIPGILIVSAFTYLPEGVLFGISKALVVALGALIGGLVGFVALMRFVLKGNPQAGLPLLNGGTILGYLISYMILYGDFGFGLTFSLF